MIHDGWTDVLFYIGFFVSGALIFGSLFYQIGRRDEMIYSQRRARKMHIALNSNPYFLQIRQIAERRKGVKQNVNLN